MDSVEYFSLILVLYALIGYQRGLASAMIEEARIQGYFGPRRWLCFPALLAICYAVAGIYLMRNYGWELLLVAFAWLSGSSLGKSAFDSLYEYASAHVIVLVPLAAIPLLYHFIL